MKKSWIFLLYIAFVVTKTQSASISTTETLVVAKTDDEVPSSPAPSEPVTEEPNAPIKLTEMRVRSEVSMRYAHTSVVTHVRNPASKAQEATFHVLLPDTAFISGFVMTLGGKSYKAYVKEKNEAKQIFNEAVSQGMGAAHIAAKARDSNHFTVSVNVEPKSVAIFNLTYEELLVRRFDVCSLLLNLNPGDLVRKLEVVVHIKESQKITTLRVPEVRTGNEIDATEKDAQNSKAVITRNGDKEATITFTPDLEEQMNLIKIYKEKTKESASQSHHYWEDKQDEDKRDGILGQFVVQYDVERSNNGEVLVNDGYFVHFLAPTSLPPLSKYVVFVLDTSSSMIGRKVEQLIAAMDTILSNLNPTDYFSIVEFNSDYSVHQLKEADEPQPEPSKYSWYGAPSSSNKELVPPALASPENIAKAKVIVSRLRANGGTNIYSALSVAVDLIHKFSGNNNVAPAKSNTTDADDRAVATANDVKIKPVNELEPIIIFLTDGDPTIGETSTARIISHITEKNSGEMRASLFSLAFGEDADRNFLRKLSLRNEGFMRHIYEAADAALQLRDFYRQVSSPLLAHVKFTYPKEQIKEGSVSKSKFRTVYAGSEVVVAGELADDVTVLEPVISGFCGNRDGARVPYEDHSKFKVARVKDFFLLERLWAYLSIKQLLDQRDASEGKDASDHEKKALNLALKYSFVTPLTSLVVVKPNETNAVDAESVDKNNRFADMRPQSFNSMPSAFHSFGGSIAAPSSSGGHGLAPALALQGGFTDIRVEAEEVADYDDLDNTKYTKSLIGRKDFSNRISINRADSRMSYLVAPTSRRNLISATGNSYRSKFKLRDEDDYDDYTDSVSFAARPLSFGGQSHHSFFQRPFIVSTTAAVPTTEIPDQKKYHLDNYSWALGLLNSSSDALIFMENNKEVVLELSKDAKAPQSSSDESCVNTPTGAEPGPASCVYITRCIAARNITAQEYYISYCRVDNKYAGFCCPNSQIEAVVV